MDKNSSTKNITTYILIFFFFIFLFIIVYFSYTFFFPKEKNIDFSGLINPEFNENLTEREKNNLKTETIYVEIKAPDCVFQGKTLQHGEQIIMYSRQFVRPFDSCEDYRFIRTCSAGLLVGAERFKYFKCETTNNCSTDDNIIIKNNEYAELYSVSQVNYGDECSKYKGTVKCIYGHLSGDNVFKYKKCTVSLAGTCKIDGKILRNGQSHIFYQKNIVDFNENCADFSSSRHCHNGFLQGNTSYQFLACSKKPPRDCFLSGIKITHESSRIFYSKSKPVGGRTCQFFSKIRECFNGVLSESEKYFHLGCN